MSAGRPSYLRALRSPVVREERLWLLAVGAVAALVLGYAAANFPPLLVIGGAGGIVLVLLVLEKPAVAAMVTLLLVSNIPRDDLYNEALPIKVTDVLLGMALVAWIVGAILRPNLRRLPSRAVVVPLFALLGLAFASILTARLNGTELALTITEIRPLLLLLLLFPVVASVHSIRELEIALTIFLGACSLEAGETVLRALRGQGDEALFAAGATRVAAVYLYPVVLVVWSIVLLPLVRTAFQRIVVMGLAGLGIGAVFYTFERGSWIAGLGAAMVIVVLLPRGRRWNLIATLVPLAIVGGAVVTAVNSQSADSVASPLESGLARLQAVFALEEDVSSRYRINEWTEAGETILEHPFTGIGLGSSISFENPMWDEDTGTYGGWFSTYYIHNSYIWVTLKLGIFGLFAYVGLLAVALWRGYKAYQRTQDVRRRRLLLGLIASLCALAAMALTGQHGTDDPTTPYLAIAIACLELVPRLPTNPGEPPGEAPPPPGPSPSELTLPGIRIQGDSR